MHTCTHPPSASPITILALTLPTCSSSNPKRDEVKVVEVPATRDVVVSHVEHKHKNRYKSSQEQDQLEKVIS